MYEKNLKTRTAFLGLGIIQVYLLTCDIIFYKIKCDIIILISSV